MGGQGGAVTSGLNVMPASVPAPPPPEFEMKGNDFPALPGDSHLTIAICYIYLSIRFYQCAKKTHVWSKGNVSQCYYCVGLIFV